MSVTVCVCARIFVCVCACACVRVVYVCRCVLQLGVFSVSSVPSSRTTVVMNMHSVVGILAMKFG